MNRCCDAHDSETPETTPAVRATPATELRIEPVIFDWFPGLTVCVAAAHGVDNTQPHPSIPNRWQRAWLDASRAVALYENPQSHPRVRPLRERFKAMGVSSQDYPSAVEAILRRALRGGEPFRINPLVDFCNAVSLEQFVPVGVFDLQPLPGPVELRLSRAGDMFEAFDDATIHPVPAGQVVWASGATVLTRFFWRQARLGLVSPSTRSALLVSEVLGEVGREVAEAVLNEFAVGLEMYFDVEVQASLLDARQTRASWECLTP